MAKYKIMIENVDDGADWDESIAFYCDGFMIVGKRPDGFETALHNVSGADMAMAMITQEVLRQAAYATTAIAALERDDF